MDASPNRTDPEAAPLALPMACASAGQGAGQGAGHCDWSATELIQPQAASASAVLALPVAHRHPCKFRAFVVGNNAYQRMRPLTKCVNDAWAMGALLERKGYVVTLLEDAVVGAFDLHLRQFAQSLSAGSTVILYFSGHGCQVAGVNCLVSVDQSEAQAVAGASRLVFLKLHDSEVALVRPSLYPHRPTKV
jgi:hypothetical protein